MTSWNLRQFVEEIFCFLPHSRSMMCPWPRKCGTWTASRKQKLRFLNKRLEFTQLDDHRTLHNDTQRRLDRRHLENRKNRLNSHLVECESERNIELGFWGTFNKSIGYSMRRLSMRCVNWMKRITGFFLHVGCCETIAMRLNATGFHTIRYSTFCCNLQFEAMQVNVKFIVKRLITEMEKSEKLSHGILRCFFGGLKGFF